MEVAPFISGISPRLTTTVPMRPGFTFPPGARQSANHSLEPPLAARQSAVLPRIPQSPPHSPDSNCGLPRESESATHDRPLRQAAAGADRGSPARKQAHHLIASRSVSVVSHGLRAEIPEIARVQSQHGRHRANSLTRSSSPSNRARPGAGVGHPGETQQVYPDSEVAPVATVLPLIAPAGLSAISGSNRITFSRERAGRGVCSMADGPSSRVFFSARSRLVRHGPRRCPCCGRRAVAAHNW